MDPALLLAGALGSPAGPLVRSPLLFDWRARELSLTPRSAQTPTFSRAATASGMDANGAAITHVAGQPVWEMIDTDADSVRDSVGLLLGANDRCSWAYQGAPRAALHYTRFQERGTVGIAAARLWELGGVANRILVYKGGGAGYAAYCEAGGSSVTSQLTTAPAANALVELVLVQFATGAVRLIQSIANAGPTNGGTSGALAFPASGAYGTAQLAMNTDTAGTNAGAVLALAHRIAALPSATWTDQQYLDYARAL